MSFPLTRRMTCLLFLLTLAWFLRRERVELPPLTSDEAFSWRLTTYSTAELLHHMPGDAHPPLYYLVLKGWTSLFGDSPLALRGLSILFSLASIVVLYVLCREAAYFSTPSAPSATGVSGAFFGALLLAIHLVSVDESSRNARMYSQGVFLAGLSAWLLLRGLRCSQAWSGWWLSYGLAVATFCYTHYYAFFTVAAQAVFVAGDLALRARRNPLASLRAPFFGFCLAGTLALLLYVPWLPVWWKQTHDVWDGFWIPPVNREHLQRVFFSWSTGLPYLGSAELLCWSVFLFTCVLWMVGRGDRGGAFLLLQMSFPWLLSLVLSAWSGRPIFHERYLVFAQFFLLAFWGLVWDRLPGLAPRLALACFLGAVTLSSLEAARARWPTHPPAEAAAAAFLRDHYRAGDLVVTESPSALNRLRYYAAQAGMPSVAARCFLSPFQPPGHIVHLGSLQPEDILWNGLSTEAAAAPRVWNAGRQPLGPPRGANWREVYRETFDKGGEDRYTLILHEPSP